MLSGLRLRKLATHRGGEHHTNRTPDGRNNIAGIKVAELRKNLRISQRELADRLAVIGLDIDKNAVQRMESGIDFSFQSKNSEL